MSPVTFTIMNSLMDSSEVTPRVLHLDDNARDAELVRDAIESELTVELIQVAGRSDYEVAFRDHHFELILCDFYIPGYSGLAALEHAKRSQPDTPVIMLSGALTAEDAIACMQAGATDYLLKQRPERLVSAIQRALQQAQDRRIRRQAEEALVESERFARAALDSLTAHVVILDERGVILAANQKWRTWVEDCCAPTPSADIGTNYFETARETVFQNQSNESFAQMTQGIREVIAGQRKDFSLEYECICPQEKRWYIGRVTRFAGVGPVRVVVAHENITQMKILEQHQQRGDRLESLGRLAGGIAHDLNNALAPITMSVGLLRMLYPERAEILDTIGASAERGAEMVRQLITFAKGAEGERILLQPGRLLSEMERIIRATFPKNIQLQVRFEKGLPSVHGDGTQLHQVLLNLCVNARDAMPNGGLMKLEAKECQVDAHLAQSVPGARPGHFVLLRVSDTGSGIPPEILDRIFDPFFTTKGPQKGTGLGLSTVMGIVKSHEGFMHVETRPERGTTFDVYLPAGGLRRDTEPLRKPETTCGGQGEIILFVDDEAAVRQTADVVLKKLNFVPLTATDGADGLLRATQHRGEIKAVITDLHMPHMDGLGFVRALRRLLPDIPTVIASGRLEDEVADEFASLGVTERLDKPFSETQLAETLRKVLAQAQMMS